jgi:hypothetical protein
MTVDVICRPELPPDSASANWRGFAPGTTMPPKGSVQCIGTHLHTCGEYGSYVLVPLVP